MSTAALAKAAASLRVVIVGGVAGGATAAARARRLNEGAAITLLERAADVSIATCGMPYFVAGEIKDRGRMALNTPKSLSDLLAVDVRWAGPAMVFGRALPLQPSATPSGSPSSV